MAKRQVAGAHPRTRPVSGRVAPWLVVACYLLGAIYLTCRLWADPAVRTTSGDPGPADADLFAWSMRYAATAVSHGHLPSLVTTAMNAPLGINLMWNTTIVLPAILLAPVTLTAGPQVALAVLLTFSYAGSAASLFWVLRRWDVSLPAAALGGAVYGFSPAQVDTGISHYNLVIGIMPPLIVHAVPSILAGRSRPVRTGVALGLMATAQLFTAEELLADTALATAVMVMVVFVRHRRAAWRAALTGFGAALAVFLVTSAYGLWVQFHGPLTEHGSPWQASRFTGSLGGLVNAPGTLLLHTHASAGYAAASPIGVWEYLGYLGLPLLIVLPIAAVAFRRDTRVLATSVTWLVLELSSLTDAWLAHLPLLSEILPGRLALPADGAAAVALAVSLDLACGAIRRRALGGRPALAGGSADPVLVAALAVAPLVPLPMAASQTTPVPAGWREAFAQLRLAPDARVLTVPVPQATYPQAMSWQTATGDPGQLIGGWFIGPGANGKARSRYWGTPQATAGVLCLNKIWATGSAAGCPSMAALKADLRYWNPAAVVAVTTPGSAVARLLTTPLGPPALRTGSILAWR
jgi:hypothetical protein